MWRKGVIVLSVLFLLTNLTVIADYTRMSIPVSDNKVAFLTALRNGFENLGWQILLSPAESKPLLVLTDASLPNLLLGYSYNKDTGIGRIQVEIVFGGSESRNCNDYQKINELNSKYNLTKLYMDKDGNIWCETIFYVYQNAEIPVLNRLLRWYGSYVVQFLKEHQTDLQLK